MPKTEPAPPHIESQAYSDAADAHERRVQWAFDRGIAASPEDHFHQGYNAGFAHGSATVPTCGVLGCKIAGPHGHEKTPARIDDDYARGIRDAAAMFEGRGHVPKKAVHASILSLLQVRA